MANSDTTHTDSRNWDREKNRLKVLDGDMMELFRALMEGVADSEEDEPMTAKEWLAYCDAEIERRLQNDEL